MSFAEFHAPSGHFSKHPAHECRGVCFHHTVKTFGETLAYMQTPASKVSYHVVIAADGTRACLVPDERPAWHAGVSVFQGYTNPNDILLGAAFAGDTHRAPLTGPQIASALDWLAPRWRRHGWTPDCMTDHRQIAPGRKDDLAPAEWERLIAAITRHFA